MLSNANNTVGFILCPNIIEFIHISFPTIKLLVAIDSYCSFFSNEDFTIPMHILSNTCTAKEMIDKINYCIETGLYTFIIKI